MSITDDYTTTSATPAEILAALEGRRVTFGGFCTEAYDSRTANGARYIRLARATVRNVAGTPMIRHHGRLTQLFATKYTTNRETGSTFISLCTIDPNR